MNETKIADALKSRDNISIALLTFSQLDSMRPPSMPYVVPFTAPEVIRRWRGGGTIPEELRDQFATWLAGSMERSSSVAEAKRRLRASMWAEVVLRASAAHGDYAAMLAEHHRESWKVARVSDVPSEREIQIAIAVGNWMRQS